MNNLLSRLEDIIYQCTDAGAENNNDIYLIRANLEEIHNKLSELKIHEPFKGFKFIDINDIEKLFGVKL